MDTEIEVSRDGNTRKAILTKQKDGEDGVVIPFALEPVKLGYADQWGAPVTSCVVLPDAVASFDPLNGLNERQRVAFEILQKAMSEGGRSHLKTDAWRTMLSSGLWMQSGRSGRKADDSGVNEETFKRKFRQMVKDLTEQGLISVEGDHVSIL